MIALQLWVPFELSTCVPHLHHSINSIVPNPRIRTMGRRLQRLERSLTALTARFDTDHCASTPCQNGGSCRNELGTFACACPPNFEGATCATDRNECAAYAGTDLGCQNGATCENTYGGYRCSCATGWKGVDCTRRTVDCLAGPAGDLCGHGACVQTNDARGYTCVCEQGWRTDGVSPACTVDVNECTAERPHCSMDPPVPCVNLPGSYVCGSCPAGFEGNGYYCRDVDECAVANGGCSTVPTVRCINTRVSGFAIRREHGFSYPNLPIPPSRFRAGFPPLLRVPARLAGRRPRLYAHASRRARRQQRLQPVQCR